MEYMKFSSMVVLISCVAGLSACSGGDGSNDGQPPDNQTPTLEDDTSPDNARSNSLSYGNETRVLNNGIVEYINNTRGHYQVDVNVSDSEYSIYFYTFLGVLYSYWYPSADSAMFSVDLYSSALNELVPGTYRYVDIGEIRTEESTPGQSVFAQAKVAWDFNGDGNADDDEELDVVDGTVIIDFAEGNNADLTSLTLSWDVLLTNGERSTGQYAGELQLIE